VTWPAAERGQTMHWLTPIPSASLHQQKPTTTLTSPSRLQGRRIFGLGGRPCRVEPDKHRRFNQCLTFFMGLLSKRGEKKICHPLFWGGGTCPPSSYAPGLGSVGNVIGRINEVNRHRARLVLGWVTVCRRVNHLGV